MDKVNVKGSPSEIGFAHGVLLANNIKRVMKNVDFVCKNDYGYTSKDLADIFYDVFEPRIKENYPDIHEEIHAIAKGSKVDVKRYFYGTVGILLVM